VQGIVLEPVPYLIYTSYLPASENTTVTFADDGTHEEPAITSVKLKATIHKINECAEK
jgi:hypothetical protein